MQENPSITHGDEKNRTLRTKKREREKEKKIIKIEKEMGFPNNP